MAWTAKLIRKERDGVSIRVIVEYTNGTTILNEAIALSGSQTLDSLKAQVYNRIQHLTNADTIETSLAPGEITPTAPTAPTQAEINRQAYADKLNKLRHMDNAIKLGVFTGNETAYTTLKTQLTNTFDPSYLDLF